MYDPHSARLLRSTDWRRVGALRNLPSNVRQWGAALNATELEALGQARLASGWQGSASHEFWQFHPIDQTAVILCRANASAGPGWSIDLLGEDGMATGWVLKADRGAALKCACHCDWRPDCPGIVSVPARSPPPADRIQSSAPEPRHTAPSWADRRRERVAQRMGWADQSASVAETVPEPQQAASVPDGWRWPSSAPANMERGEAYRGELHQAEQYDEPAAEPVPLVRTERRGFLGALFGGRREELPAIEQSPSPSQVELSPDWNMLGQPAANEAWRWPEPLQGPPATESLAIEDHGAFWEAPALPAPEQVAIGWDAPTAVWSDPEPSYEALPAPALEWERPAASWEVPAIDAPQEYAALLARREL